MTIRPQMFTGLLAVGCVGLAGIHFATAQQDASQKPDSAKQVQRDSEQRGARQRTDRRSEKSRIDSRKQTTVRSSTTTAFIRSSVFIGAPVSLSGGASLGTIQEVVFTDGGCVDYVIVSYDNRLVPVPWIAGTFRADDRAFLLTIEESQLGQLPTFTDYGQLSDTQFVAQVNTFYKVEERTRERSTDRRDGKSGRNGRSGKSDAKAETDKGQPEADKAQKSARKSREAAPRTEQKSEGGQNGGAEGKKADAPKADAPKADAPKSDAPKSTEPQKDGGKPAEK